MGEKSDFSPYLYFRTLGPQLATCPFLIPGPFLSRTIKSRPGLNLKYFYFNLSYFIAQNLKFYKKIRVQGHPKPDRSVKREKFDYLRIRRKLTW